MRCAGSLRNSPSMTGRSGPALLAGGTGSEASAASVAIAVVRPNGDVPSTAAKSVAPSDQRSLRGPAMPSRARSGAMYAGEPRTRPVRVTLGSPGTVARPQSVSTTRPSSAISTLPGLMSRCRTPRRWAARSAPSTPSPISAARAGGSVPSSARTSCSERLATYSITIHGSPSVRRTSKIRTTLTWLSRAIARGLAQRPFPHLLTLFGGQSRRRDQLLDRHLTVQDLVVRLPDTAHATLTERLHEPVPVGDNGLRGHRHRSKPYP